MTDPSISLREKGLILKQPSFWQIKVYELKNDKIRQMRLREKIINIETTILLADKKSMNLR